MPELMSYNALRHRDKFPTFYVLSHWLNALSHSTSHTFYLMLYVFHAIKKVGEQKQILKIFYTVCI